MGKATDAEGAVVVQVLVVECERVECIPFTFHNRRSLQDDSKNLSYAMSVLVPSLV
jgi:hypothetical protein